MRDMPTPGTPVSCPPDRGQEGYRGIVTGAGESDQISHQGVPFGWVSVRHPRGHSAVWPSNRLTA